MPQLDFIIIFPQIFWLIITFFSLYIVLVHFFLPIFIKILKSRKQIIIENNILLLNLQEILKTKQKTLTKKLEINFLEIKKMLDIQINPLFKGSLFNDLNLLDKKISKVIYYLLLHHDLSILESIPIKPLF